MFGFGFVGVWDEEDSVGACGHAGSGTLYEVSYLIGSGMVSRYIFAAFEESADLIKVSGGWVDGGASEKVAVGGWAVDGVCGSCDCMNIAGVTCHLLAGIRGEQAAALRQS